MVSRLREAEAAGAPWTDLASQIDHLLEHVRGHFATEEDEMERAKYPKLEEHRHLHQTFMRRLQVVRDECDRRETELMSLFTELLENWFKNHERTADQHVLEFLGFAEPPKPPKPHRH